MRVLAVDDDAEIAMLLEQALSLGWPGMEVVATSDPKQAADPEWLAQGDLLLTDLDLEHPRINGITVAAAARLAGVETVVFITGSQPTSDLYRQAEQIGPVIRKPFVLSALSREIARLLGLT